MELSVDSSGQYALQLWDLVDANLLAAGPATEGEAFFHPSHSSLSAVDRWVDQASPRHPSPLVVEEGLYLCRLSLPGIVYSQRLVQP